MQNCHRNVFFLDFEKAQVRIEWNIGKQPNTIEILIFVIFLPIILGREIAPCLLERNNYTDTLFIEQAGSKLTA